MADDYVQVAPDSTGKKIDNTTETTGAGTVERQRVSVAAAGSNNQLAIDANGALSVSANTVTAGTVTVLASTITSIPSLTVTAMNAGTVTAATVTSMPNLTVGASTITSMPAVSVSAGTVNVNAATITAALPTGTNILGGFKLYDPNGNTAAVVTSSSALKVDGSASTQPVAFSAGTVTSVSAGTVSANQGTANATPWNENLAQVGGTTIGAVTKGVQTANALPTQHYMDAGRTPITFNADRITGTTAETALTVTINKNGTTSSASTYLITTGKILHIQGVYWSVRATSTTMVSGRGRLRYAGSSVAPTTATALLLGVEASAIAALAESTGPDNTELARGLELAGNTAIGFSHIESSTLSTISMNVIAFEY